MWKKLTWSVLPAATPSHWGLLLLSVHLLHLQSASLMFSCSESLSPISQPTTRQMEQRQSILFFYPLSTAEFMLQLILYLYLLFVLKSPLSFLLTLHRMTKHAGELAVMHPVTMVTQNHFDFIPLALSINNFHFSSESCIWFQPQVQSDNSLLSASSHLLSGWVSITVFR